MKGLELAEKYYETYGKTPLLRLFSKVRTVSSI